MSDSPATSAREDDRGVGPLLLLARMDSGRSTSLRSEGHLHWQERAEEQQRPHHSRGPEEVVAEPVAEKEPVEQRLRSPELSLLRRLRLLRSQTAQLRLGLRWPGVPHPFSPRCAALMRPSTRARLVPGEHSSHRP